MSTLGDRYASPAMREIWSAESKIRAERRLWIAVMRFQSSALSIPESAIKDYEKALEKIDLQSIERREKEIHHDVKARIDEFNSLTGHEYIHIGMTSRDLTENIELYQIKNSLDLIYKKSLYLLKVLRDKTFDYKNLPITSRTHNVPAQVTTLGRKFAYWTEELIFACENTENLMQRLPLKGINGAVGTKLDMKNVLSGSHLGLQEIVENILGINRTFKASSQVYPRSLDFEIVSTLNQLAMSPNNIALNVRLMSGIGHVSEQFDSKQIGSTAMPHKVNPRLSERVNSLFIVLKGLLTMAAENGGNQWNEGDVSCSAARRVFIPDSFMTIDAILETTIAIVMRLVIDRQSIEEELSENIPQLSSTTILMLAVKRGVGREIAHSRIKEHSRLGREDEYKNGKDTFFSRVLGDKDLKINPEDIDGIIKFPLTLVGDAEKQCNTIVQEIDSKLKNMDLSFVENDII